MGEASGDRFNFEATLKALSFEPGVEVDLPPNITRAEDTHLFEVRALILGGALHLTCGGGERTYRAGVFRAQDDLARVQGQRQALEEVYPLNPGTTDAGVAAAA